MNISRREFLSGGAAFAALPKFAALAGYYLYLKGDKATIGTPGLRIIIR